MPAEVAQSPREEPILQFSVFADNKIGRLNELVHRLQQRGLHILALSSVDATECSVVRFVPNYPDETRNLLGEHGYPFSLSKVLAVELQTEAQLPQLTSALVEAEVNIHYLYPFLLRPRGKVAFVLFLEDLDFGRKLLSEHGFPCLTRRDLAR